MSFWRCHFHIIWTIKDRLPAISVDRESIIAKCLWSIADDQRIEMHAVGMVDDHVHVAVSIPPRLAAASIVKLFKGSSSNQLGKLRSMENPWPGWQAENGIQTFDDGSLERVNSYVKKQKEHHHCGSLWAAMEQVRGDQPFDEGFSP